jgi:hypothetical protein
MQLRMIVIYFVIGLQGLKTASEVLPIIGHCLPGGRLKALPGAVGDSSPGQTVIPLSTAGAQASSSSSLLHTLYCDHHGWLVNWLKRRAHCVQDASDLAQDTYMRLLRQCSGLQVLGRDLRELIGGYIVTRAHRLCMGATLALLLAKR